MEVIADLREDMFGRFPLEIAQFVDAAALHGGLGPHLADGTPQPCIAIDNGEHWRPQAARDEIRDAFHRIAYAASPDAARVAYGAFERAWSKRCPGVVASLREGGDELLTFFRFPKAQWKTLRTTNVIERLHEEFRRRVKTQARCRARTPR